MMTSDSYHPEVLARDFRNMLRDTGNTNPDPRDEFSRYMAAYRLPDVELVVIWTIFRMREVK